MNTTQHNMVICLFVFFLLCIFQLTSIPLISSTPRHEEFLLQQLIDDAKPYDQLILPNGTFHEHLTINKPLRVIGSGHTIIDGTYKHSVMIIQSNDVHILNIGFRNSGGDSYDSGIIAKGLNITIENCDFSFSKQGIQFNDTALSTIRNCSFHQLGRGISLIDTENVSIQTCVVSRCGIGTFISGSKDICIKTSTFMTNGLSVYAVESMMLLLNRLTVQDTSDNHGGLFFQNSSIIQINHSYIHHNGIGINIDRSNRITISTCQITNNTHFGILLRPFAEQISITNCLIKDNLRYGIYCYEKTTAFIMGNIIADNYLFGLYSKDPVFILDENWWDSSSGPTISPFHSGNRISLNNYIFHFGRWNNSSFCIDFPELIPRYQHQQNISRNISMYLEGTDSDSDGAPDWWEEKWGYQINRKEDHHLIDDDDDGLTNLEECYMDQWGSNPFKKDVFLEIDWMVSKNPWITNKPSTMLLDKIVQSFASHNISLHIDDGCFGGGGEIPDQSTNDFNAMIDIYWDFFLDKQINNPRKGIFHYAIISDECADVSYPFIGWDSFDGIAVSSEKAKNVSPYYPYQMIIAGGIMHQLGSTLGLTVETHYGNDNWRTSMIGSFEWMLYHRYRSSMNYLYKYRMLNYSDGSKGTFDFDDWSHLDLAFFKETSFTPLRKSY